MAEPYQGLPRHNQYNSKFFDRTNLYQDIPVHIRHIRVSHSPTYLGGYTHEHLYVYSSGPHLLYYNGANKGRHGFVDREELKNTWNMLRRMPSFSYQTEDKDMSLNELLKTKAHIIDDYTEYIENGIQQSDAIERNMNTCTIIDQLRLGLAPEQALYPAFHYELKDIMKNIQDNLKFFFQHQKPPERNGTSWLWLAQNQSRDAYNISYYFDAYQKDIEKDLIACLKDLREKEGDGPSPVAGSILPGAKTIPEAMRFFEDFHRSMADIQSLLMKDKVDTVHHEMMQADILMTLQKLGEKYPDISLIQEPIQAIQKADKAYQEDHSAYAAYVKENEAKTGLYVVEGDLTDKLPQVSISFKDGTTIQDDLFHFYYECQYGAYRERLNDDVVSFTVDQEKHQPRVMDFASLIGSEPRQEAETIAPLQSTLQDILAAATKDGRVFLEENTRLGEVRPTFRYYSSREAAILDQYQHHQDWDNIIDDDKTDNPYHEIEIGQKDCVTCKKFYVDGEPKGLGNNYSANIDTMMGANLLPELRVGLSNADETLKQAVFAEQCLYVNNYIQSSVDIPNDTNIREYSAILDKYVNEYEQYGVPVEREAPEDYEKDIDPHIAGIAFPKVKKEYPTATQEQYKQFVGNLIQENSPNGFIKGRNYGYSIAEKVQKEQTAKKQKKMTH